MVQTIKDFVNEYEPKEFKNIADLEVIDTEKLTIEERDDTIEGKTVTNYYTTVDGVDYRIPTSVLVQIKTIQNDDPSVTTFKVIKTGEGLNTRYTVRTV